MTLTGLRYFVALAELRNFSRVAEQYYVAQAAVTYQIKNMEKELGVKLFERSTRSVKLTPAGHNLYMDVAPLLKQLDAACKKAKMRGVKKTFTIGYSRICFGNAFKKLLDCLAHAHTTIDFVLELVEPEYDLFERLHNGDVDMVLFFDPYPNPPDYVSSLTLGRWARKLVISEQHPYANREYVEEYEIEREEVFACEGMRMIEGFGRMGPGADIRDNQEIILRDMESVIAMVKSGRGVACLPVIDDLSVAGLKYIPIRDSTKPENGYGLGPVLTLAWNKDSDCPELRTAREAAKVLFCNG